MKRFLFGFLLSLGLITGVVYVTVILPENTKTDVLGSDKIFQGDQESFESESIATVTSDTYRERIAKGDTLFQSGHFLLAGVEYQAATQLEPRLSEPYFRWGQAQFHGEKYQSALTALQKAVELDASNQDAHILLGKTMLKLEQTNAAQALFDGLTFENIEATYYQGILAAVFGDYDKAIDRFNKVIEIGTQPELAKNAANFLDSMSTNAPAEDPNPMTIKTLVARSLAETEETSLAIPLLYDVLREEPDYRDAWIILGYSYLSQNKFPEAQNALFKAVELDPTKAESRYFLGLSYFGLDDYTSAVIQLELAIESGFEPQVQAHQKLGDAAVLAQNYPKAAEAYEKVLILNSSDIELFVRPVWLNIEHLNEPDRALELANQAVREHPGNAMAYNLLGWAQISIRDMENAGKNLRYALIIDPKLPAAHYNLGLWNEQQGNLQDAEDEYKQAYTLDPGGPIGNLAAERYNTLMVNP